MLRSKVVFYITVPGDVRRVVSAICCKVIMVPLPESKIVRLGCRCRGARLLPSEF